MRAMDIFNKDDSQFISWNFDQKYIDKTKDGESLSNNNDTNQIQDIEEFNYVLFNINYKLLIILINTYIILFRIYSQKLKMTRAIFKNYVVITNI